MLAKDNKQLRHLDKYVLLMHFVHYNVIFVYLLLIVVDRGLSDYRDPVSGQINVLEINPYL